MPNGHYNEEEQICECEDENRESPEEEEDYESVFDDSVRWYPGGPVDMDSVSDKVLSDAFGRLLEWLFQEDTES